VSGRQAGASVRLTPLREAQAPVWLLRLKRGMPRVFAGVREKLPASWPLWSILIAQTVLTVPWLWRTAPFTDEALYIEAGHAEWAHWLHHAALPDFPMWFSGAPVLYPPLAGAADSAGGLAAARAVSLVAMLATTVLVYLIGDQVFGRFAGALAALLFAVCGLIVHYGAFATFGPLSLFLLVLSAWSAVRIRDEGFGWLPACAVALVAANATKYATLAWDPVILGTVLLHGWVRGKWLAIGRTASLTATVVVVEFGFLMLGGKDYANGVIVSTVFRSIHWVTPSAAPSVLQRALLTTGLLVVPALLGVAVSIVTKRPLAVTLFLGLLVLAGLLAPIDQARIHQLTSLDKNIGYGLPFVALGAGYALSAGRAWLAQRKAWGRQVATTAIVVLVAVVLVSGSLEKVQFRGPEIAFISKVVMAIGQSYRSGTFVLSDGASRVEQYYLPAIPPHSWIGTFKPTSEQKLRIEHQFRCGLVSVVVISKAGHTYGHPYDLTIIQLMDRSDRYRLTTVASQGASSIDVWKMERAPHAARGCG
jgi:4-amino-4-deoxy-L-arabinose transferase-like glycosyltransferase